MRSHPEGHMARSTVLAKATAQNLSGVQIGAEQVELLRVGKDPLVMIGGEIHHLHERPGGHAHAVQFEIETVVARLATDRRRVTQHFVERRVPQQRIAAHGTELLVVLK